MEYFLTVLFLLTSMLSFSQDSSGIQKLEVQFRDAYYYKFNVNENFLIRLSRASTYVFNLENDVFYKEVSLRKKQNKNYTIDTIAGSIFDSVVVWFTKNHLWDHAPYALSKYQTILTLYNERFCACMTAKLKPPKDLLNESDIVDCTNSMNIDTAFLNKVRTEMKSSSMAEAKFISELSRSYVFQNCPVFYNFFIDVPRDEVIAAAAARNNWYLRDIDKKISELYISKSFAKLSDIFPRYKDYARNIEAVKGIFDKKDFLTLYDKRSVSAGKTEITKTYYGLINRKPDVYGQAIYVADEENMDPLLLSFQFFTADKIKDLKAIVKKINEEEIPPEVQELEDMKIGVKPVDSLPKKKGQ